MRGVFIPATNQSWPLAGGKEEASSKKQKVVYSKPSAGSVVQIFTRASVGLVTWFGALFQLVEIVSFEKKNKERQNGTRKDVLLPWNDGRQWLQQQLHQRHQRRWQLRTVSRVNPQKQFRPTSLHVFVNWETVLSLCICWLSVGVMLTCTFLWCLGALLLAFRSSAGTGAHSPRRSRIFPFSLVGHEKGSHLHPVLSP